MDGAWEIPSAESPRPEALLPAGRPRLMTSWIIEVRAVEGICCHSCVVSSAMRGPKGFGTSQVICAKFLALRDYDIISESIVHGLWITNSVKPHEVHGSKFAMMPVQ